MCPGFSHNGSSERFDPSVGTRRLIRYSQRRQTHCGRDSRTLNQDSGLRRGVRTRSQASCRGRRRTRCGRNSPHDESSWRFRSRARIRRPGRYGRRRRTRCRRDSRTIDQASGSSQASRLGACVATVNAAGRTVTGVLAQWIRGSGSSRGVGDRRPGRRGVSRFECAAVACARGPPRSSPGIA